MEFLHWTDLSQIGGMPAVIWSGPKTLKWEWLYANDMFLSYARKNPTEVLRDRG